MFKLHKLILRGEQLLVISMTVAVMAVFIWLSAGAESSKPHVLATYNCEVKYAPDSKSELTLDISKSYFSCDHGVNVNHLDKILSDDQKSNLEIAYLSDYNIIEQRENDAQILAIQTSKPALAIDEPVRKVTLTYSNNNKWDKDINLDMKVIDP